MIIGWNSSTLKGNLLYSGQFYLTVESFDSLHNTQWLCTLVYEPNDRQLKQDFWNEVQHINGEKIGPLVIYDDFNTIFSPKHKNKGILYLEDI